MAHFHIHFHDAFEEAKHKRDPKGEFTSTGGGAKEPKSDTQVVTNYQENAAINDYLRGDKSPASGDPKKNKELIKQMDEVINKAPLLPKATLYRGYGGPEGSEYGTKIQDYMKNGKLRDPAYLSTTDDINIARKFSGKDEFIAAFNIPANTLRAYNLKHDSEFILPRGLRWKLGAVHRTDKILHFTLE